VEEAIEVQVTRQRPSGDITPGRRARARRSSSSKLTTAQSSSTDALQSEVLAGVRIPRTIDEL
jgi:hypothetical protein